MLRVDDTRMRATLEDLGRETGTRARDGAISLRDRPRRGHLGAGGCGDRRRAGEPSTRGARWPTARARSRCRCGVVEPRIDEADLQAAVRDFANPALSGPVTLVFADSRATLAPRDFAPLLSMRARPGGWCRMSTSAELAGLVGLVERDAEPVDASVALVGGAPEVVPARPGATYGPAGVAEALLAAVREDGAGRTVRVKGDAGAGRLPNPRRPSPRRHRAGGDVHDGCTRRAPSRRRA